MTACLNCLVTENFQQDQLNSRTSSTHRSYGHRCIQTVCYVSRRHQVYVWSEFFIHAVFAKPLHKKQLRGFWVQHVCAF